MIFGRSDAERDAEHQELLKSLYNKRVRVFAFLPKRLTSGRVAWLQWVWAKHPISKCWGSYGYSKNLGKSYYLTETGDE